MHCVTPALVASLLALSCLVYSPHATAAVDPTRQWFTVKTPHFEVHSYDGGVALAHRVASLAEDAYLKLTAYFSWRPDESIHIRVVDDVDAANGYAYVTPYPGMTLYAFPPEATGELAHTDDWLRMLIAHELAHIIHLDCAGGQLVWMNRVLGRAFKPNQLMPRWLVEGIATWLEVGADGAGRVNSSRYNMLLRTAALQGKLLSLEDLGGEPLAHPRRASWYVYGSAVVATIAREAGRDAIATLVQYYGERLIPFGLNIATKRATGHDLQYWFDRTMARIRHEAEEVSERLTAQGLIQGEQLTHSGEFKRHLTYTADGTHVVYQRSYGHRRTRIVSASLTQPDHAQELLRCDGGCGKFVLLEDGEHLLASMGRPFRFANWYSELVRHPLRASSGWSPGEQITTGARLRDPSLSAISGRVWASTASWGATALVEVEQRTGRVVRRWVPPPWARVEQPIAHPDGDRLFAVLHHRGNSDLIEIDLRSGARRPLTSGPSIETDLHLTQDGHWLVYASDHSGVSNLYARDVTGAPNRDGRTFQLTRVLTGAFDPATSPDGRRLMYVGWTDEGEELFSLAFKPEQGIPSSIGDPLVRRSPPVSPPEVVSETSHYDPLSTIQPRIWLPTFSVDGTGLWTTSLSLGGQDISERFGLIGQLSYRSDIPDLSVALQASLNWSYPQVGISVGRYVRPRFAFISDTVKPFVEQVYHAAVEVGVSFPHPAYQLGFNISYGLNMPEPRGDPGLEHSPEQNLPYIPPRGVFTASRITFSFSDLEQGPLSLWPTAGFASQASLRFSLPQLGSSQLNYDLTYVLRGYIPIVEVLGHVLALRLSGGYAGGREGDVEPFTLGGVPQQDLIAALINQTHAAAVYLRGFSINAFTGTSYHQGTAEYRLPLVRLRSGLDTLPLFARDLSLAVFSDVALVHDGQWGPDTLEHIHGGVGAELRFSADIPVSQRIQLRLGYAFGLGPYGLHHVYVLLAPPP